MGRSVLPLCLVLTAHSSALDFRPSAARTVCPVPSTMRSTERSTFRRLWFPSLWMLTDYPNIMARRSLRSRAARLSYSSIEKDQYDLPDYAQIMDGYEKLNADIKAGRILSAYAVEGHGLAEAVSKMAFGNKLGVKIEHNVDPRDFFAAGWGNIVCEVPDGKVGELVHPLYRDR